MLSPSALQVELTPELCTWPRSSLCAPPWTAPQGPQSFPSQLSETSVLTKQMISVDYMLYLLERVSEKKGFYIPSRASGLADF